MSSITLCCLQGLVNPDNDHAYYDLLNVEPKATPAQIKKSFRRQSLEMHPDKRAQHGLETTPEDVERFRRVKEAYEVLSDPQRRKVYDRLGELGLKMTENPASVPPEAVMKTMQHMSEACRCYIILGILACIGFFVVYWPVLLSTNVDGQTSVPWAVVWLPLWVV
eukprot:CAMPEP_0119270684 /NCGR_PEP_ID=MMETSP1329-20130426/7589_1 /TAXON_ID=114041 /ORGANISM="Genus nov. species nov., Strain RCC1024" /LENGTH=164 /DNA_ID=CAMNT_0007270711 /DNA_START=127 /DNA_END=618 /DNA_ORIENTATION=-